MSTWAVIGKRLTALPAVLLLVAVMTWGLAWASPFDPAEAYVAGLVGPGQSNQAVEDAYRQAWGLDEPVPAQFVNWLGNLVTGDLGVSRMIPGQEVSAVLGSRLSASALLVATSLALVLAGSLVMGVLAARFRDSTLDWFVRTVSYTNAFAPSFWVALLAIYFFSVWLGWLPATGAADLRSAGGPTIDLAHLVLPAVTLALTQHGVFTLYVRATVLESMREDHVRFARAQGASETSALFRHALPNSLVPYVTLIGTHIPELIGGSVLIETVFAWPGLGSLTVAAARAVDLPLLLAIVLAGAVLVVLGNLVADLLYRVVDPRVREARA
ncbi:MAG: ABC transporter permease [Pseudonocardiaceae bacterium]